MHIKPDCIVNVIKNKSFNEVKNLNFQVLRKIMGPVDKKPITAEIIITEISQRPENWQKCSK